METKKIFCDIPKCTGCKTCELACAVEHSVTKDLFLAVLEYPRPIRRIDAQFIARDVFHSIGCQHCDEPPCRDACMACCISKDKKTGKVDIDKERCVGCWMCVMVCPFAAISRQYAKEAKAAKCDLCPERESPACVDSCPTKALSYETVIGFREQLKKSSMVKR